MSSVRAASFVHIRQDISTPDAYLATVPAGERWKLESTVVYNEGALSRVIFLKVLRGTTNVPYVRQAVASGAVLIVNGLVVLEPGDIIVRGVEVGVATMMGIHISGFRLPLP